MELDGTYSHLQPHHTRFLFPRNTPQSNTYYLLFRSLWHLLYLSNTGSEPGRNRNNDIQGRNLINIQVVKARVEVVKAAAGVGAAGWVASLNFLTSVTARSRWELLNVGHELPWHRVDMELASCSLLHQVEQAPINTDGWQWH